jgi:heme-degrading monooxygenase HmoA
MFAVIFEVQPKKERWDEYLELAKKLKPKLEAIEGFIDNERFESKKTQGRVLSLSTWRDEKAVVRWRTHGEHHGVQEKGRFEVFEDYHLRVQPTILDDPGQYLRARARVNVNLELSRSGNGVRNGFRRPDGRGSGQFVESALDTLYVARNRG